MCFWRSTQFVEKNELDLIATFAWDQWMMEVFIKAVAKLAHITHINTSHITAGQRTCLAFSIKKEILSKIRRGIVVLRKSPTSKAKVVRLNYSAIKTKMTVLQR